MFENKNRTLEDYAVNKIEYLEMRNESLKAEVASLKEIKENIKKLIVERFEITNNGLYQSVKMNSFYSDDHPEIFCLIEPLIKEVLEEQKEKEPEELPFGDNQNE